MNQELRKRKKENCICCKTSKATVKSILHNKIEKCKYCYSRCPGHSAYCNKGLRYSKITHKLIERNYWGVGKALCTKKKIPPAHSSYIWKEITCKRCLKHKPPKR